MDAASAMGSIALWGSSPAIDFTVDRSQPGAFDFWSSDDSDAVSVLFLGVPDLSHIIQNLPEALRRSDRPVNFYILENSVEVYARQLLLLWLICEPADSVGLQEKVWMFLEIVGNTLIRPSTERYIAETATKLIDLVTGGDECTALPLVSLAALRHRERDQLAAVFQFWRTTDALDVAHMWDLRLRQQLAQRYDARQGVFDWDYYMRLKDRLDIEFVQPEEYKHWRETGVAFRRPGTEQTCVNRTLVTVRALGRPGERQLRRGYWGDIVSGPFASFGLRTDDPSLSRKQNGRLASNAATVSAANLESLLSGISASAVSTSHVRIHLLPADGGAALSRRAAYRCRFSAAVFSSGMSHLLTPAIAACLRDGATIAMETARYIVCVTADQQGRLLERYDELADTADCRPIRECETVAAAAATGDTDAVVSNRQVDDEQDPQSGGVETGLLKGQVDKSSEGEMESGGAQSGEKQDESKCAESATELKMEASASDGSGLQSVLREGGYEMCDPAGKTNANSPAVVEQDTTQVLAPADIDAGDLPKAIRTDDKEDQMTDNDVLCKPVAYAENGAGEPTNTEATADISSKDDTVTNDGQADKPPPAVEPAVTEEPVSQEPQSEAASVGERSEVQPDVAGSTPSTDTVKPVAAAAGRRHWVSDKLTALPEWVCFVKRRADGVIADLLSW